jgi:N-methylhydantoinase A
VRSCSRAEDPDLFDAARVGVGALGILSTVTLQCVPAFRLHARETIEVLDDVLDGFAEQAEADFADEGHGPDEIVHQLELDLRSGGQLYVTTIKSPVLRITDRHDLRAVLEAYFAEYADRFGEFALSSEVGVSVETVRLRAAVPRAHWEPAAVAPSAGGPTAAQTGTRDCWWARSQDFEPTPVYDHGALGAGDEVAGPAVIEGTDTTVLVNPGWSARLDGHGFLHLVNTDLEDQA